MEPSASGMCVCTPPNGSSDVSQSSSVFPGPVCGVCTLRTITQNSPFWDLESFNKVHLYLWTLATVLELLQEVLQLSLWIRRKMAYWSMFKCPPDLLHHVCLCVPMYTAVDRPFLKELFRLKSRTNYYCFLVKMQEVLLSNARIIIR